MLVTGESSLKRMDVLPTGAGEEEITESVIDPTCDDRWDSLVMSHSDCTVFHSAAWARTLRNAYGHRAMYQCYHLGKRVAALVPLVEVNSVVTGTRGVCVPFADSCGPLLFDSRASKGVGEKLQNLMQERQWKYLEIRGVSTLQAKRTSSFHGHSIDLQQNPEKAFECFSSPVRRAIRKAQRNNLSVSVTNTRAAIINYYRLHTETRRRHGVPPQPLSFFLALYDEVLSRGFGFMVLVSKGSRAIAGAVFLHFGRHAVYKYGASDLSYQELRGNNLVFWEAIKYLSESGVATLHLGRTSLESESLRRFKLGWGAREESIDYVRLQRGGDPKVSPRDRGQGAYTAFFRRMPLIVNRWAGAMLYRHLD